MESTSVLKGMKRKRQPPKTTTTTTTTKKQKRVTIRTPQKSGEPSGEPPSGVGKKKVAAAEEEENRKKFIINLTDPLKSLKNVPNQYLLRAINEYVVAYYESGIHKAYETASSRNPSKEFVNKYFLTLINILRYVFPWKLTVQFIREYNDRKISSIRLLKEFMSRDAVKTLLRESKEFIKSREGKVYFKRSAPPVTSSTTTIKYLHGDVAPRRQHRFSSPQDLLTKCELYFRHAEWLDENVIATLLRVNSDEALRYGTNFNQGPDWVRAKVSWYKYPCDVRSYGRRLPFKENTVAYLTINGRVIVETREIYDKSLAFLRRKFTDIEREEIYPEMIRKVVFDMLKENDALVKSGMDMNALTSAIVGDNDDVKAIRDRLTRTLVYLQRIIKQPQVHIERVESGMFDPKTLVKLNRDNVLPEVFKNPSIDQRVVERVYAIINSKMSRLHDEFERRLAEERSPTINRTFKSSTKYVPTIRYPGVEEPKPFVVPSSRKVYYNEDDVLYTFSLDEIETETINPRTGKPFDKAFLDEIKLLSSRRLADGLFERVRDDLLNLNLMCQCSTCDVATTPFGTSFSSKTASSRVNFCDAKCFERFTFF